MKTESGERLRSSVCSTEVVVVRPAGGDVDLRCGGAAMVAVGDAVAVTGTPLSAHADGTRLGKRYADEQLGLEILCTKPGDGSLSIGDTPLALREAKPLPASD